MRQVAAKSSAAELARFGHTHGTRASVWRNCLWTFISYHDICDMRELYMVIVNLFQIWIITELNS